MALQDMAKGGFYSIDPFGEWGTVNFTFQCFPHLLFKLELKKSATLTGSDDVKESRHLT